MGCPDTAHGERMAGNWRNKGFNNEQNTAYTDIIVEGLPMVPIHFF